MFDVGFSEMLVIGIVALVVIGPERLPRVARTLGHLFGRMQRYVNDVKADINREIELEELRKFKEQVQDAAQGVENTIKGEIDSAKTEAAALERSFDAGAESTTSAAGAAGTAEPAATDVTAAGEVAATGAPAGDATSAAAVKS